MLSSHKYPTFTQQRQSCFQVWKCLGHISALLYQNSQIKIRRCKRNAVHEENNNWGLCILHQTGDVTLQNSAVVWHHVQQRGTKDRDLKRHNVTSLQLKNIRWRLKLLWGCSLLWVCARSYSTTFRSSLAECVATRVRLQYSYKWLIFLQHYQSENYSKNEQFCRFIFQNTKP
jgi:hypothetical protein